MSNDVSHLTQQWLRNVDKVIQSFLDKLQYDMKQTGIEFNVESKLEKNLRLLQSLDKHFYNIIKKEKKLG